MSANNGTSDSIFHPSQLSSFVSGRTATPGMDLPPSRYPPQSQLPQMQRDEQGPHSSSMPTLTLRTSSMLPSPRYMSWEDTRPSGHSSRPRSPTDVIEKVELPSIRQVCAPTRISRIIIDILQAIPEIQLRASRGTDLDHQSKSMLYSPSDAAGAEVTHSDYVRSPSQRKRRRLSEDDDNDVESRDRSVPRMYRSSPKLPRNPNLVMSPTSATRHASAFSSSESWTSSTRTSPYISAQRPTGMRSPPLFESSLNRSEWRPILPSLPSLTLERGPIHAPRGRNSWSEYALEATRSGAQTYSQLSTSLNPSSFSYHPPSFSSGYQQPRGHSYSGPSSLSLDRTPFSANHHHLGHPRSSHPYGIDINDGNDGKQRKRRGNLPKETTDKLRAWFVAHLQHPYPTEDEKQDLMRQTGLQMSRCLA